MLLKVFILTPQDLRHFYDSGNIDRITVPRTEEGVFSWGLYDQKWGVVHVVSGREVEMAQSGGFTGRTYGVIQRG